MLPNNSKLNSLLQVRSQFRGCAEQRTQDRQVHVRAPGARPGRLPAGVVGGLAAGGLRVGRLHAQGSDIQSGPSSQRMSPMCQQKQGWDS